jgi:hypothetical protein
LGVSRADASHTPPSASSPGEPRWAPDEKTLHWAFGTANENRIQDTIRDDVRSRGEGLQNNSAEYWNLVAEVAIEAVLCDLVEQAKKLGSCSSADTSDGSAG